jgi:tetratricopeptide (TPR) repeat protein
MSLRPLVVALLLLWARPLLGQSETVPGCDADAAECGKRAFDAGIEAYRAKKYSEASERFQVAYELRPHPVVLFNWALAESRLEKYVEALEHFEKVLADPETPSDLRATIEEEKATAGRNVGTIEVDAGGEGKIFVDERVFEGRTASARVNPGTHHVRVEIDGREVVKREVTLKSGERVQVAVNRTEIVKREPTRPVRRSPEVPRDEPRGLDPIWVYAGAGLTAVLGGVTLWSALDTKSSHDDYERALPTLTQAEVNQRVDDGHKKELRNNVLIGGTALVGVGTVVVGLFLVDWKQKPTAKQTVGVRVGIGSVAGTLGF